MIKQILLVGLGGAVGSILRFLTSAFIVRIEPFPFPLATFLINILGCFCIGLFANLVPSNNLRMLLITGFCGGFTTFSSFTNENFLLLQNGQYLTALIYIGGSIMIGILAVFAGFLIANQL